MSDPTIYEHKIVLTVLAPYEDINYDLDSLNYETMEGDYIGDVDVESVTKLSKDEAVQRCFDLRSQPEFFFIDDD